MEPFVQFWTRVFSYVEELWNYIEFRPVVHEDMLYKDISYLELWWPFCWRSKTIYAILVKGIMRNNSVKLFRICTSGSGGDVVWRHFLSRVLWKPLCLTEQDHLCNFGRRHNEEQFCQIILNLIKWFRRRCRLKIFYLELLWQPFCLAEWNHLCNFSRGHHEEHTIQPAA